MLVVVVLPHWRFLRFRATFPCHRHSTLTSQTREGLHQLWALYPGYFRLLSFCQVLRGCFLPTGGFYLAPLPHILARFCDSDEDRNTSSRILLCACPHRVVYSGWRMVLNYLYCRWKTIGLSIAPVSLKVWSH